MPSKLGDLLIHSGVHITPVYGATEFGGPAHFFRKDGDYKDWEYITFSDRCKIRWDPQGDGTYEAQFLVRLKTFLLSRTAYELTVSYRLRILITSP